MLLEGVRSGRGIEVGSTEWKEFLKELAAGVHTQTNTITGMKPGGSLTIDNPAPFARLYAWQFLARNAMH